MSNLTRVPNEQLVAELRRAPRPALCDAVQATLQRLHAGARSGRSVLAELIGDAPGFAEWQHYPPRDAVDARSGYRFYYHAHSAAERAAGEHGHFHVFASSPAPAAGVPGHVHLFALSVDARGLPSRVFTTNRWVTAETWKSARWSLSALRRLDLSGARPRRVAAWLQDMAQLFAPQIRAVVRERDLRVAERASRQPLQRVLEDRRTHIVTQCRVDLARQFECLQVAGIH